MKTAIKLVLIYFLMQLIGALFAGPFCLLYTYFAYGTFDMDKAGQIAVAPTMRWPSKQKASKGYDRQYIS